MPLGMVGQASRTCVNAAAKDGWQLPLLAGGAGHHSGFGRDAFSRADRPQPQHECAFQRRGFFGKARDGCPTFSSLGNRKAVFIFAHPAESSVPACSPAIERAEATTSASPWPLRPSKMLLPQSSWPRNRPQAGSDSLTLTVQAHSTHVWPGTELAGLQIHSFKIFMSHVVATICGHVCECQFL